MRCNNTGAKDARQTKSAGFHRSGHQTCFKALPRLLTVLCVVTIDRIMHLFTRALISNLTIFRHRRFYQPYRRCPSGRRQGSAMTNRQALGKMLIAMNYPTNFRRPGAGLGARDRQKRMAKLRCRRFRHCGDCCNRGICIIAPQPAHQEPPSARALQFRPCYGRHAEKIASPSTFLRQAQPFFSTLDARSGPPTTPRSAFCVPCVNLWSRSEIFRLW